MPGAGYMLLGKYGRGAVAFVGVLAMTFWGLHLGGELSTPVSGALLSQLKAFACLGLGVTYFAVTNSIKLGNGLGDVTSPTEDYGCSLIWAAGLISYLLILDVFDIAVGRKG